MFFFLSSNKSALTGTLVYVLPDSYAMGINKENKARNIGL